jgi:hypothetical protein
VGRRVVVVVGGTVQRVRSNGVTAERLDPPAVVVVYFTVARVFGACVRWGSVFEPGPIGTRKSERAEQKPSKKSKKPGSNLSRRNEGVMRFSGGIG